MNCIVFHHIPKCAGTSVRDILAENITPTKNVFCDRKFPIRINELDIYDFFELKRTLLAPNNSSSFILNSLNIKFFVEAFASYYLSLYKNFFGVAK
jgi:hypothetical protein